jgi:alpha-ketoglutarate-dependent taurine dioxygenase
LSAEAQLEFPLDTITNLDAVGTPRSDPDDEEHGEYDGYGMNVEPPLRPLVKTHPETGRTTLMIGRHAFGIPTLTTEQSEQQLAELTELVCQPPRIYEPVWSVGDGAVWDNRSPMHRACPYDMQEARIIRNCRILGDAKTEYAAHA